MSVNYDQNKQSFNDEIYQNLILYLKRSFLKGEKTKFNSSSVAITDEGYYYGGLIESKTNLLHMTSEQVSILNAVSCKDVGIKKIITIVDGEYVTDLIAIKIMLDYERRTGINISYEVFDIDGNKIYFCNNLSSAYHYNPEMKILEKTSLWKPSQNFIEVDSKKNIDDQMKEYAMIGTETHFNSDSGTLYGASALAGNKIYFGGVYSSFDKRLNVHSEMTAAILAIMDGNLEISKICLVSDKFVDKAPHMCGCCRQFFSEVQKKLGKKIEFISFSYDGLDKFNIMIDEYLPNVWDNK